MWILSSFKLPKCMHYIGALTHNHHVLSRQMMSAVYHNVSNNLYYNMTYYRKSNKQSRYYNNNNNSIVGKHEGEYFYRKTFYIGMWYNIDGIIKYLDRKCVQLLYIILISYLLIIIITLQHFTNSKNNIHVYIKMKSIDTIQKHSRRIDTRIVLRIQDLRDRLLNIVA